MRALITLLIVSFLSAFVSGCGSGPFGEKPLRVATTTGPHAELLYAAREVAAKDGLTVEILEYGDNLKPNDLLVRGEVDANCFQPLPYFENLVEDRRLPLVAAAKTVVFPVALYSKKIARLADLPPGATVAIPNDPASGGRALILLAKLGIITLKPGLDLQASVSDITANPRNIAITETDAAEIVHQLDKYDLAAVNAVYAVAGGLVPIRDALASEGPDSPYAHIIAVREKDKDNPAIRKLIEAYRSDHVKRYTLERFQGAAVPTW